MQCFTIIAEKESMMNTTISKVLIFLFTLAVFYISVLPMRMILCKIRKLSLFIITLYVSLIANPVTLLNKESGFYQNSSNKMIPIYENTTCKDEEVINYIPIDAVCIIALERHKNGKAFIEYKGQRGWVDMKKNPDDITMIQDTKIPLGSLCSQVGSYYFEIKSIYEEHPTNVYKKPSIKSKIIAKLPDHESCLINLGCDWPWCRIDFGIDVGYVLSINLTDRIQNVDGYCYPRYLNPLEN